MKVCSLILYIFKLAAKAYNCRSFKNLRYAVLEGVCLVESPVVLQLAYCNKFSKLQQQFLLKLCNLCNQILTKPVHLIFLDMKNTELTYTVKTEKKKSNLYPRVSDNIVQTCIKIKYPALSSLATSKYCSLHYSIQISTLISQIKFGLFGQI